MSVILTAVINLAGGVTVTDPLVAPTGTVIDDGYVNPGGGVGTSNLTVAGPRYGATVSVAVTVIARPAFPGFGVAVIVERAGSGGRITIESVSTRSFCVSVTVTLVGCVTGVERSA